MPVDSATFRRALGQFSTGITVVSCRDEEGRAYGVTVNSFNSVSLQPPLALFSLGLEGASTKAFLDARAYGVSVLAEGQEAVSRHFAQAALDKWAAFPHETLGNGCPAVPGSLVSLACAPRHVYEGGDHRILVVSIEEAVFPGSAPLEPLLYFRGGYRKLQP